MLAAGDFFQGRHARQNGDGEPARDHNPIECLIRALQRRDLRQDLNHTQANEEHAHQESDRKDHEDRIEILQRRDPSEIDEEERADKKGYFRMKCDELLVDLKMVVQLIGAKELFGVRHDNAEDESRDGAGAAEGLHATVKKQSDSERHDV